MDDEHFFADILLSVHNVEFRSKTSSNPMPPISFADSLIAVQCAPIVACGGGLCCFVQTDLKIEETEGSSLSESGAVYE